MQRGIAADPVEPDAAPGIAVAVAHRDQADMDRMAGRQTKISGHEVAIDRDCPRAERVAATVAACERQVAGAGARDCDCVGQRQRDSTDAHLPKSKHRCSMQSGSHKSGALHYCRRKMPLQARWRYYGAPGSCPWTAKKCAACSLAQLYISPLYPVRMYRQSGKCGDAR